MTTEEAAKLVDERIKAFARNPVYKGRLVFEVHIQDMSIDNLYFQVMHDKEACKPIEIKTGIVRNL